jgi:hypothetical protein
MGTVAFLLCASWASALDCPTPGQQPEPNDATGWANSINGCLPQGVPSQTVGLGTFEAAPPPYQGMFWNPDLVPCVVVGPIGGFDRWCEFPRPAVRINSFNVLYEIAVRNKPPNYDLEVVLTIPTLQGTRDYFGIVNATGDGVTIPFHPDTIGTQVLTFFHEGEELASYEITTTLEPQLGAFVVPYLPVAIVYQPPGSESTARFTTGSSIGTTLCWGTSATSGVIETQDWSLFFGDKSDLVDGLVAASGPVGAIPQASWVGTVGKVLDALDNLYHTQTDQQETVEVAGTLCQGSTVSTSIGYETEPGHGDLYLLRKDALFAYVVVLKDPASGNTVAANGVPTVILTLVHSVPVPPVYLDDLERDFPPEVVAAFTELNGRTRLLPHLGAGLGVGQRARMKRLPGLSPVYCTPDSTSIVSWEAVSFTSSDVAWATTTTTTTHVTGYVASIFGDEGTVTQSITLSSNQANWEAYEQGSQLSLKCPEIDPPYQTWAMDIFLDNLFGTLLAVPGEMSTTSNPAQFSGVVVDGRGHPVGGEVVTLAIGGRTVGMRTSEDGRFVFHVPELPRSSGTILVARQAFQVSYRGTPVSNLRLTVSR